MNHILQAYAFLWFWSIYGEIHREFFFLVRKVPISETSTETLRNFFFYQVWKGQILRKFWIRLNSCFWSNLYRGQILTITFFLPKVSHILLNTAFLLFWRIFGDIQSELFFLVRKVTSQKWALKHSESLFFLPYLKRNKSWGKNGLI